MAKKTISHYCEMCGIATFNGPKKYCAYCEDDPSLEVAEMCYVCTNEPAEQYGLCLACEIDAEEAQYKKESHRLCETCWSNYAQFGSLECAGCAMYSKHGYGVFGYGTRNREDYYWEEPKPKAVVIPSVQEEVESIMAVRK